MLTYFFKRAIRGSVVSLSVIFFHLPEDKEGKKKSENIEYCEYVATAPPYHSSESATVRTARRLPKWIMVLDTRSRKSELGGTSN